MTGTLLACIALFILLVCSAFFSSSETALFSLNSIQLHRLRDSHATAVDRISQMLAHPTNLLSTILIGNTVINVCAASVGYIAAERLAPGYGELIAIPVMTTLLLILGEVAPKRLALAYPERLALIYQPLLFILIRVLRPIARLLESLTTLFEHSFHRPRRPLSEDEFRTVVEVGEEEGILDEEERDMVDGIIRLEETVASEVMTPRVDLVGIDLDDSLEANLKKARNVKFRYLPIYRDSLDNPIGFLDVPRFLLAGEGDISQATISPFFVPETAPLDTLLSTFQREHKRVAFVIDEFGGTAGLITRGDILEEIIPDVDNEYGDESFDIQQIGEDTWLIEGSTSLEEINSELEVDLEAEGADRIAGWISAEMERIPRVGDSVEAQGIRATVQRARRNRILLVQVEKITAVIDTDDDEAAEEEATL